MEFVGSLTVFIGSNFGPSVMAELLAVTGPEPSERQIYMFLFAKQQEKIYDLNSRVHYLEGKLEENKE